MRWFLGTLNYLIIYFYFYQLKGYRVMGYNSFNRVLSPLITKKLYNIELYAYMKDRELTRNFKTEDILENDDKKSVIE